MKHEYYNGIKLYNLSEGAYEHYRTSIKGNVNVNHDEARRKLTRNINLAVLKNKWTSNRSSMRLYCYGCLHIIVREDTIIRVKYGSPDSRFHIIRKDYDRLTKRLDLDCNVAYKVNNNKLRWRHIAKYK